MTVKPEQIAVVRLNLPEAGLSEYGWTDEFIQNLMETNAFSPAQAIRMFWYQRVSETAEYIDINGKPLSQIHENAKDMLKYWDSVIASGGADALSPNAKRPMSFGVIERPVGYDRNAQ